MVLAVDAVLPSPSALGASLPALAKADALAPDVRRMDAIILATSEETIVTTINMVSGDTRPTLEFTVKDENGVALNLTGATGLFRIRRQGSTVVLVSRAITITDATNGKCQFAWSAVDWNTGALDAPGKYEGELEITFSGGGIGTTFALYAIVVRSQIG